VRKYMIAYVQCQMCKNFDSNLVKESATRLTFLGASPHSRCSPPTSARLFPTLLYPESDAVGYCTRGLCAECNRCGARMSVQNVEKGFHATNRSDRKAAKAAK